MTTQENTAEMSLEPAARSVPLVAGDTPAMREWAEQLVARARAEGVKLTGDDGLLTAMIRQVLQTGLEVELADHLGYEPYDPRRTRIGELARPQAIGPRAIGHRAGLMTKIKRERFAVSLWLIGGLALHLDDRADSLHIKIGDGLGRIPEVDARHLAVTRIPDNRGNQCLGWIG